MMQHLVANIPVDLKLNKRCEGYHAKIANDVIEIEISVIYSQNILIR